MKNVLIIIFCLGSLISISQPQFGMSKVYTLTPTSATTPSVGIAYGNTITLTCFIKNHSSSPFTGLINIYKRIDTAGTSGIASVYDSIPAVNFLPNDSIQITITDSIKPSAYRQDGNGNTIVVWPYVSGALPEDTLYTVPVYVPGIAGMEELTINYLSIFPNPASNKLIIKTEQGVVYERIRIYDMQSKQVLDGKFKEETDIHELPPGVYWIDVTGKNNKRYGARFIKTE